MTKPKDPPNPYEELRPLLGEVQAALEKLREVIDPTRRKDPHERST